jgi:hypothetical protein
VIACSRRFFQASITAAKTWSKPGMPRELCGGQ